MARCSVCFHHCEIPEGRTGFCGARVCREGIVTPANYGVVTGLALDPIEKKPLRNYYPGSRILSVGSFGCNLRCPFCQNHDISWSKKAMELIHEKQVTSPESLAAAASHNRNLGNIGLAFTYNEPLIGYEYVRDTAKLIHEAGMINVLVSNGTAELSVLDEIGPYIDAMNIDLKGFSEHYYRKVLGGDLNMVKDFISHAVELCHVELTTLIIPGENDSEAEMQELSSWVSALRNVNCQQVGNTVPLHISRFFPRFHMTDRPPTPVSRIYRLAEVAREHLDYVYTGNC